MRRSASPADSIDNPSPRSGRGLSCGLRHKPRPYDAEDMGDVVRVGLLGCGNVGSAVIRMLAENAEEIARRAGASIEVTRVAVRELGKPRDVPAAEGLFTADPRAVVRDPDVD